MTSPAWLNRAAALLTPRRIRAHAIILAVCLWGVCAVDFLTPGVFDRAGNIKFQDFLSFYISGKLLGQGHAADFYNEAQRQKEILAVAPAAEAPRNVWFSSALRSPTTVLIPNLYGPQVAAAFAPFTRLSFITAAELWIALNLTIYFLCIYAVWRCCPQLRSHARLTALAAIAFPPLFHFFVRGQLAVIVLACFTAAYVALESNRPVLAGFALGCLVFKPQFLVAIPLILLLARAWKILGMLIVSAAAQLACARIYSGAPVMHSYFDMLLRTPRWISIAELQQAPIQMHSLRAFWTLLIPSPAVSLAFYLMTSVGTIAVAAVIWKSQAPFAVRFSALTLAAVLVNPHLFVYDLLILAPLLLLLTNWFAENSGSTTAPLRVLLYLAFILPLFGPISQWTHLQLSVPVFAAILWFLFRVTASDNQLAISESRSV